MMKLVDISDLGSDEFVRGGSSPSIRNIEKKVISWNHKPGVFSIQSEFSSSLNIFWDYPLGV